MRLVIVESPKKARTIQGFLGGGYRVAASMGHVRDLPAKAMGVDVGAGFVPQYEVLPKAQKTLSGLRAAVKGAESVLLATDPDREGEAIAWHLAEALRLPRSRYRRITFHEISRKAIQEALAQPRDLDPHLIDAQQARRVLDRLVGYGLSPLLWRKVRRGTSAGRVQSVAVRLVVDREREIQAFVPVEYWTIDVRLCPQGHDSLSFLARLVEVDGKKAEISDSTAAETLVAQLERAAYAVRETRQKTTHRNPFPPFTTSTLQQAGGNRLRFSAKRTMAAAQSLYEAGLITYMRTDSVAVSGAAIAQARQVIAAEFGPQYVPDAPRRYSTRSKNAQEAHEAIRPVDLAKTPASLRATLAPDEWRVYDLVWKRMVASQMPPARYLQDTALVDGRHDSSRFVLKAQATSLVFRGWLAAYGEDAGRNDEPSAEDGPANDRLPALETGQPLDAQDVLPAQHFTQPPPRYTEPALVKALEDAGVGRPSTYATVVSTIQDRGYVEIEQRHFIPTELGFAANDFLVAHFPSIVDLPFTAQMEDALDQIAGGMMEWTRMLDTFYGPFSQTLTRAQTAAVTDLKRSEAPAPVSAAAPAACPQCGKPLVQRQSQYGPFLGCSSFPACRYIHREDGGAFPAGRAARPQRAQGRQGAQGARRTARLEARRERKTAREAPAAARRLQASNAAPPSPRTKHVVRGRRSGAASAPQRTVPNPVTRPVIPPSPAPLLPAGLTEDDLPF